MNSRDRDRHQLTERRGFWLLLAAVVIAGAAASIGRELQDGKSFDSPTPGPNVIADCFPPRFLQFGGVYYLAANSQIGRSLNEHDLGAELGQVHSRIAPCAWSAFPLRDGDAMVLDVGTPIHAVKGYASSFRVAARVGSPVGISLYEAARNPEARTNGELLDISDRVVAFEVRTNFDRTTLLATVCDLMKVDRLVDAILAAPLRGGEQSSPGGQYYLVFQLADGTASGWIAVPPGQVPDNTFFHTIAVPSEVLQALEQAGTSGSGTPAPPIASPATATETIPACDIATPMP